MSGFKNVESSVTSTEEAIGMSVPYLYKEQTKLLLQVVKDLERHEGYRFYAYADPLTPLYKKYAHSGKWGYVPARQFLQANEDLNSGKPWTVGHGHTHGITVDSTMTKEMSLRKKEALVLEIDEQYRALLSWYKDTSFVTRTILINMAFNMGVKGVLKFRNTLEYIKAKNYAQAAANMRQSLWFKQTGSRAAELCRRMETQEIPVNQLAPEKL